MSVLGDHFRQVAESYDNLSEVARHSADAAKAAALNGLSDTQALINALGGATSDKERLEAVQALLDDCIKQRDSIIANIENMDMPINAMEAAIEVVVKSSDCPLIEKLLQQLKLVFHYEALRDHFRAIAVSFDTP